MSYSQGYPQELSEILSQILDESEQDTKLRVQYTISDFPEEHQKELSEIDLEFAHDWYRNKLFFVLFNLESQGNIPRLTTAKAYIESLFRQRIHFDAFIDGVASSYNNRDFIKVNEVFKYFLGQYHGDVKRAAETVLQQWAQIEEQVRTSLSQINLNPY